MYYWVIDLEWVLFFVSSMHGSFQSATEDALYGIALAQLV